MAQVVKKEPDLACEAAESGLWRALWITAGICIGLYLTLGVPRLGWIIGIVAGFIFLIVGYTDFKHRYRTIGTFGNKIGFKTFDSDKRLSEIQYDTAAHITAKTRTHGVIIWICIVLFFGVLIEGCRYVYGYFAVYV